MYWLEHTYCNNILRKKKKTCKLYYTNVKNIFIFISIDWKNIIKKPISTFVFLYVIIRIIEIIPIQVQQAKQDQALLF